MIPIQSLLTERLPWDLGVRAMPPAAGDVSSVALVEDLSQTGALSRGTLVVLTRATIEAAGGYQFDVFVRQASQRQAAAVVLRRSTARSLTAEALAARGGVALLDVADDVEPASVVDHLATLVAGDARVSLRRLAAASALSWDDDEWQPAEAVQRVSASCGVALDYEPGAVTGGAVVMLDGLPVGTVTAREPGDLEVIAARLGAEAASAALARRERLVVMPVRTASAALNQLLLCSQANLPVVAARAAELGLDVTGWHCAARLAVDDPDAAGLSDLESEILALVAEHIAPSDGGNWSVARPDDSVVVVRTTRQAPRGMAPAVVRDGMEKLASMLRESSPGMRIRVGIANPHEGPAGLRVSADEARTALAAARSSDEQVSMSNFDSLGGRRMLAEWLTTPGARDAVRELLAPVDALGPTRSATAVATLHAYLDEHGSLQRAATRLHLHRNAVVYRLDRIKALGFDLTDPDTRFALQLACRARLMTTGRLD